MAEPQRNDSVQTRIVAVVIAVTMMAWLGFQWLGSRFDLPAKYAYLADLMAIAAMVWSLIVTLRIWRRRDVPPQR